MYWKISFFISIFVIFFCTKTFSQSLLNQNISITQGNYKIGNLLKEIEKSADVKFSYNSELIDTQKEILFSANNGKLEDCLDEIFENKIKYQISGKHIILLKKTLPETKSQPKQKISIFGTIINADNNETLSNVSVYDLDNQFSTISNYQGEFEITINSNEDFRGLSLGKRGFYDTVIIVNTTDLSELNVYLQPKYYPVEEIKPIDDVELKIDEVRTTNFFIPKKTIVNSQNLEYLDITKNFQISFLPGLSSNLSNFGVVKNKVSLNILIGYSRGVKGFEAAALMNFDKENVEGLQLAGLTNTVGGKVTGFQGAGLFNVGLNDVNACQLAGLGNFVHGSFNGFQGAGIFNSNFGNFEGIQMSSIINLNTKKIKGIQTSGILNISGGVYGVQSAGILNFNWGDVSGVQTAGVLNFNSDTLKGLQLAGISNIGKDCHSQVSGVINLARSSKIQLTPVFNFTIKNQGFQAAVINYADTSSGVSLGLITFVRRGLHKFKFSSDEIFHANMHILSGNDKLYNIYSLSFRFDDEIFWGMEFGFGHKFNLTKFLKIDLELTFRGVNYKENWTSDFFLYNKVATNFEFDLKNDIAIYFGPSFNYSNITKSTVFDYITELNVPQKVKGENEPETIIWWGFSFGISF